MRRRIRRILVMVAADVLNGIPRRVARRFGQICGAFIGCGARKQRRATRERIALALELDTREADRLAIRCAATVGGYLTDAIRLETMSRAQLRSMARVKGIEELRKALLTGSGALVVGGHVGNWELLAAVIADSGIPLSVIGRRPNDPILCRRLERLRAKWDIETLWRDDGARPVLRALRANRAVGVLIDQATNVRGTWAPFFGRDAWTPIGPARLALRTGCPVVMAHIEDTENGHIGVIERDTGLGDEDAEALTRRWTRTIETWIRRSPQTWVWMHDRWKQVDSVPVVSSDRQKEVPA